jgi:hypothetical protein
MRLIRKITDEEENFRTEPMGRTGYQVIRRNPVKPEPEGTIILLPFRITGYNPDCDGSLMVCLDRIDINGEATGWSPTNLGLYSDSGFVVTADELKEMGDYDE